MRLKIIAAIILIALVSTAHAQTIKGTFAIKNVETGKLLRIKDANRKDGTPLVLYSPVNWKCMTWDFKNVSGDTYQLRNLFTGKTFFSSGKQEGTSLKQTVLAEGNDEQHWDFLLQADNTYLIRLSGTNLYLTPSDSEGAINTPVILISRKKNGLQRWIIYKQNPSF